MGIGRQVADAYIDVHGDLSKFRRDLEGSREDVRKAARENADDFSKAWGDRVQRDVNGKWGDIVNAMYSENQVDWDRMIGAFDSRNLDEARKKITEFLREMRDTEHWIKDGEDSVLAGMKLENEQFDHMIGRLHEVVAGMQKREEHQRNLIGLEQELQTMQDRNARVQTVRDEAEAAAHSENDAYDARRKKTMEEAIAMNKEWARTWEGMRKNNFIKDMGDDFKKLGAAMTFADMAKFAKSFDNLDKARARINEVTAAMEDQGRISRERAQELHDHFNAFMDDVAAQVKAEEALTAETDRLRKAQDDYNASLSGMARNAHFSDLEGQFRNLARAMDSNDWSHFARGAESANAMRIGISNAATEMHRLGRMSDHELSLVHSRATQAALQFGELSGSATRAGQAVASGPWGKFAAVMGQLGTLTKGLREHLAGFAGLNVFGDMIEGGLEFIHNLDRIALSAGLATIKLTTMASVGMSALGGLVTIAGDLANTIGGLGAAAPAFVTAIGLAGYVAMNALQGFGTLYKKQLKAFKEELFKELMVGLEPALERFKTQTLPTLRKGLTDVAAAEGRLFGAIMDAITSSTAPDVMALMFKRMTDAMDKAHTGIKSLVNIWEILGEVGTRFFDRFATGFNNMTARWETFIKKAAANGDIEKWINTMIDGFKNLFRAIDGAFGIFNAVDSAARRAGFGGLRTFADALQGAAKIMQAPAFQTTLTSYFEAARGLAIKLGDAIKQIGPDFQSFTPTAVTAIGHVGDAVSKLVGYIGQIFKNPTFQQGVADFTGGLDKAVALLAPAIKPFADSLGNMMSLLGQIIVSVAKIAAAFTVVLSPVLDQMSGAMKTLVQPLSDTAVNFVTQMKGPLESLNTHIVQPLVAVVRDKLLPAVNRFFDKLGPILSKIIEDLGPVFVKIVEAMPKAIDLITQILPLLGALISVLTPVVVASAAVAVEKLGTAMEVLANGIKILKGELPIDLQPVFKAFDPATIQADGEKARQSIADNMDPHNAGNVGWAKVLADIFWGAPPEVFWSDVYNMTGPTQQGLDNVGTAMEGIRQGIVDDWNRLWSGRLDREMTDKLIEAFPDQADFLNGIQGWVDDISTGKWFGQVVDNVVNAWNDTWKPGGGADQLDTVVNDWLNTNVFGPFGRTMDGIGKLIPQQFKSDVKEWGLVPAIGNWFTNDIMPEVNKGFTEGWKNIAEGRWGSSPEGAKRWEGFWAGWNGFWGDTGNLADQIDADFSDWWNKNIHEPFSKAVTDAWNNFWTPGSDGGGGRGDNNGQQAWNDFWGGFAGMFQDANKWAEGINKTVNDWLNTNVWDPIVKWVKELDWNQIGADLWSGFINGVTGHTPEQWAKFTSGFTGWVEDIKKFFGIHSPSTLMFDIAADIVAGFLNGFGDFATTVGTVWEGIKTTVTTKFQELKDGLAGAWEGFKTNWGTFWDGVGTTLSTKWEEFKTTIGTKAGEINTGVNTWANDFGNGWNGFWGDTGTNLSNAWSGFVGTVGDKTGEINTNVNNWAGDVGTNWNNFWGGVGNTLSTKWGEFTGTVSDKAGEIRGGLEGFGGDVQRNWDGFWGGVGGTLSDKWNQFTGTVRDKSGNMSGDVSGMGMNMIGYVQNAMGQMWNSLSGSFQNFVSLVMYRVGDIVSWVSSLPDRIWGALSGLGNLLWASGYSIMSGLMNGLASKWSETMGWISGLADWIVANKGPVSYDATLLVPAGEAIMGGLQRGLESKMDPLLNTLQTITGLVTDSVTADLSHSVMYVAGADAAQGLADGLKANRSSVHDALGSLGTFTLPASQVTVAGAFSAVGRPTAESAPARAFTIAEGAVQVHTQATDPWIVAGTVTDALSDAFSTNSRM